LHVLLGSFGSAGDHLPLLGLAGELRDRGHEVEVLGLAPFGARARAMGLSFHPVGDEGLFEEFSGSVEAWHPWRGFGALWRLMARAIEDTVARVEALQRGPRTVLVASTGALGMRLAQEKLGLRAATLHVAPFYLFSRHDNILGGVELPSALPGPLRRLLFSAADRWFIDGVAREDFNRMRAAMGLPPVRNVLTRWSHAPDRVLLAVPTWFAPRQPDWPAQTVQTGFPLLPADTAWEPSPELARFLAAGEAPLAVASASGVAVAPIFYERAVEVAGRLGRRALLVTPFADQLPRPLPDSVLHLPFAPYEWLFPRVAGLLHQGGIGTTALALRAGLPQLIAPYAYDHFDNARRVERLGAGDRVLRITPAGEIAPRLAALLDSPTVAARCREFAARLQQEPSGLRAMAREVESLAG